MGFLWGFSLCGVSVGSVSTGCVGTSLCACGHICLWGVCGYSHVGLGVKVKSIREGFIAPSSDFRRSAQCLRGLFAFKTPAGQAFFGAKSGVNPVLVPSCPLLSPSAPGEAKWDFFIIRVKFSLFPISCRSWKCWGRKKNQKT